MALPSGTSGSSLQRKTVLIVDDDPLFQEEFTVTLAGAGSQVENAYDGETSLRHILKKPPDLDNSRFDPTQERRLLLQCA